MVIPRAYPLRVRENRILFTKKQMFRSRKFHLGCADDFSPQTAAKWQDSLLDHRPQIAFFGSFAQRSLPRPKEARPKKQKTPKVCTPPRLCVAVSLVADAFQAGSTWDKTAMRAVVAPLQSPGLFRSCGDLSGVFP
jgi:hypothetical protein